VKQSLTAFYFFMTMNTLLKHWNAQQKLLRAALTRPVDISAARNLFLQQHGLLHSKQVDKSTPWSYEDEILDGLTENQWRVIPNNGEHSIAWCIWHMARIEDITMNMLLAGEDQLFHRGGWHARMKTAAQDTGNAMSVDMIRELSETVDVKALRKYRIAVGRRTWDIIKEITPVLLKQKVDAGRLKNALAVGAVEHGAHWLVEYWGGLTLAGLLLMPPTRHLLVHLNEAAKLKRKVQ
jgi:hypothetical protein